MEIQCKSTTLQQSDIFNQIYLNGTVFKQLHNTATRGLLTLGLLFIELLQTRPGDLVMPDTLG